MQSDITGTRQDVVSQRDMDPDLERCSQVAAGCIKM